MGFFQRLFGRDETEGDDRKPEGLNDEDRLAVGIASGTFPAIGAEDETWSGDKRRENKP